MPLSADRIEYFKKLLLEEKEAIMADFREADEEYQDLINQSGTGDVVDQAYSQYEKDLLIGLSDREQETLRKIEGALRRIDEGKYGICEVTGAEIEEERLEAIPYTTLCQAEAMRRARQHFPEM